MRNVRIHGVEVLWVDLKAMGGYIQLIVPLGFSHMIKLGDAFWGDSNHVDTIRNLLNFALGFDNITSVPRRFDTTYFRPSYPSQYVRITSMFNGHSNVSLNHQGLFSLNNSAFRDELTKFFKEKSPPDVIVMNSGLHDGIFWKHIHEFVGMCWLFQFNLKLVFLCQCATIVLYR